jgi:hypothetical protein
MEVPMKTIALSAAAASLAVASLVAQSPGVHGTYVEARTAEVFAGGCIINGEAGTAGREAILAWKVERGRFGGVTLDGLAVVAAVSADANLGIHELGGEAATTKAALVVDAKATPAQRRALIAMAKSLAPKMLATVVSETQAPIDFVTGSDDLRVSAHEVRLAVKKELDHTATCGNKQWFQPLSAVHHADPGTTAENAFSGKALGTTWSDPNKRSAFYGAFAF